MVVINSSNGDFEVAKVFDTYKTSEELDQFIHGAAAEGDIVIAACKDDCVTNLSEKGKQWFADMGSTEIWDLGYRCGFAFIGIFGIKEAHERRSLQET